MKPLGKKHFGPNGLRIIYFNGTSIIEAYVDRQIGWKKFIAKNSNGSAVVTLVSTQRHARMLDGEVTIDSTLPAGSAIIPAYRNVTTRVYAGVIQSKKAFFLDGTSASWGTVGAGATLDYANSGLTGTGRFRDKSRFSDTAIWRD